MGTTAIPTVPVCSWDDVERGERAALGLDAGDQASALCLSGGGVRSAAFCLGALQALDEGGLLKDFHYLSTVSGGGFIGGWLTRWICDGGGKTRSFPALEALRCYTNYLTPQSGLFGIDSWQLIVLWLRNMLLNWALLAPILFCAVSLPILYLGFLCMMAVDPAHGWLRAGLAGAALLALAWSVFQGSIELPSHRHPDRSWPIPKPSEFGPDARSVFVRILIWALLWSILAPLAVAPLLRPGRACDPGAAFFGDRGCQAQHSACTGVPAIPLVTMTVVFNVGGAGCESSAHVAPRVVTTMCHPRPPACGAAGGAPRFGGHRLSIPWPRALLPRAWAPLTLPSWALLPMGSVLACVLAYGLAWAVTVLGTTYQLTSNRRLHNAAFLTNFPAWFASAALSAGLLAEGIILANGIEVRWLAVLGPLWVVLCDVLRTTIYVGLRKEGIRADLDREWLARLNASKLRTALVLALATLSSLMAPVLVFDNSKLLHSWIVAAAAFLTGPIVAKIASSAAMLAQPADNAEGKSPWIRIDWVLGAVSLLFMTVLFMLFGRFAEWAGMRLALRASGASDRFGPFILSIGMLLLLALGLLGILSRRVKINRFSLHALYRNRIVRAFLGTARRAYQRRPDRYTGFDPRDNVRVADCFDQRSPPRLFAVINVAMNTSAARDQARAERKAESFTITPLHCGSHALSGWAGAYVPTSQYAGGEERETGPDDKMLGISLGTALAVSGAAVSPNMGYYGSPLTAFLMTLFNLRLGAWLPNPAMRHPTAEAMRRSSPNTALFAALGDLFGQSSDAGTSLYLSDGGHFDNLGLYEMLRRRCRFILVLDAGADADYRYDSIGRVVRLASIDLQAEVSFQPIPVMRAKILPKAGFLADIRYADHTTGRLLYIKPSLPEGLPVELQSYAALNPSFPNTSTAGQFFTESEFESYRALGEHLVGQALPSGPAAPLARLFGEATDDPGGL